MSEDFNNLNDIANGSLKMIRCEDIESLAVLYSCDELDEAARRTRCARRAVLHMRRRRLA